MIVMYCHEPMPNNFEELMCMWQTSIVSNYAKQFIARDVHAPGLVGDYRLGVYLYGIKEEMRLWIRSQEAKTLYETIHVAKEVEWELEGVQGFDNAMISTPIREASSIRVHPLHVSIEFMKFP